MPTTHNDPTPAHYADLDAVACLAGAHGADLLRTLLTESDNHAEQAAICDLLMVGPATLDAVTAAAAGRLDRMPHDRAVHVGLLNAIPGAQGIPARVGLAVAAARIRHARAAGQDPTELGWS